MSKRFIDTELFAKPWFRQLPPKLKALWIYLFTNCDFAGCITVDFGLASFCIGDDVELSDVRALNGNAVILRDTKLFLPQFIEWQYGPIVYGNRIHESVIRQLEDNGLVCLKGVDTLSILLRQSVDTPKDKDKDKDKKIWEIRVREKRGDQTAQNELGSDFDTFWSAYPNKVGKTRAIVAWKNARRPPLETILDALERQRASPQWTKDDGRYIPHPTTWIHQERWNDEIKTGWQPLKD